MFRIKGGSALPCPSDKLIQSVESFYRIKFPEDYAVFLKEYNGAKPITNTFILGNREYLVERFLCLLGDEINDYEEGWADIGVIIQPIYERLTDDADSYGLPIIPVGFIFAGDLLCLDFRKDKVNPQVCVWLHEESEEFAPATEKVADSFTDFLGMLR